MKKEKIDFLLNLRLVAEIGTKRPSDAINWSHKIYVEDCGRTLSLLEFSYGNFGLTLELHID